MALRQLKPLIPRPVWIGARRAMVYVRRLLAWRSVKDHIQGLSPTDQAILDRSARSSIIKSLKRLDDWMDPQLLEDAQVRVRDVGTFQLRAFSDDLYHVLPSREPAILEAVRRLRPGELFVDAGANIGFYTIAASKTVSPGGRVIAIEMMPDTAAILKHHLAINDCANVEVVQRALSDRSGLTVSATVTAGRFGQASIARSSASEQKRHQVEVQTATLDELMSGESRPIALLKLDLEGAELAALRGATRTLQCCRSVIFEALDGGEELCWLLSSAGFRFQRLDPNNWLAWRD